MSLLEPGERFYGPEGPQPLKVGEFFCDVSSLELVRVDFVYQDSQGKPGAYGNTCRGARRSTYIWYRVADPVQHLVHNHQTKQIDEIIKTRIWPDIADALPGALAAQKARHEAEHREMRREFRRKHNMTSRTGRTKGYNAEAIVKDAVAHGGWYPQEDLDGNRYESIFIGTVFAIMPSGKFYMPWACSNVTEDEAARDEYFRESLDKAAERRGYWIENGEGDPCDMFLCRPATEPVEEEE